MENNNLPAIAPLELAYGEITLTCPIENGHRMVPVRTVCQIIDVDFAYQDSWLKKHQIYGQLYKPSPTVGLDNKGRTMNCLSFFDLFGWLNSLGNDSARKPGSIEKQMTFMAWLRERHMEIYKAVDVWRQENKYELQLLDDKAKKLAEIETAQETLREAKKSLATINATIEEIREKRFTGQTALPFPS